MTTDKSGLTAIARRYLPAPTYHLMHHNLLQGVVLDYGCGKAHRVNNLYRKMDGWDPNHRPEKIDGRLYHTIICNYVLNVIESAQLRQAILCDIDAHLYPEGKAYITVRNDVEKDHYTKRGTWQGNIILPYQQVKTDGQSFRMYVVDKGFSNAK